MKCQLDLWSLCFLLLMGVPALPLMMQARHLSTVSPSLKTIATQHDLEKARLLLLAGRPRQAYNEFVALVDSKVPQAWPEARIAFYIALCEMVSGKPAQAKDWYARACQGELQDLSPDDRAYFDQLLGQSQPSNRVASLQLMQLLFPMAMVVDEGDSLSQVAAQVKAARKVHQQSKNLASPIRYGTWLIMFGELAVEDKDANICSRAIDAMDEGLALVAQVQTSIDGDPKLEEELVKDPAVAMRLDTARVRKEKIEKRLQLARAEERERLNQLRGLVNGYRDLTEQMAAANTLVILDSFDGARKATARANKCVKAIEQIAGRRRDYYLFADEPQLDDDSDFKQAAVVPQPLSATMISYLKSQLAWASFRIAMRDSTKPEKKLLDEACLWAKDAIGQTADADSTGKDENNVLAHIVLGLTGEALGTIQVQENPGASKAHRDAADTFKLAQKNLSRAAELLTQREIGKSDYSRLAEEVQAAKRRLTNADSFLAEAVALTGQGRLSEAAVTLQQGIVRHADLRLWIAQAETGMRLQLDGARPLDDLDAGVAGGVVPASDRQVRLTRAKIGLSTVWRAIAKADAATTRGVALADAAKAVARDEASLREIEKQAKAGAIQSQAKAFLALAIAYRAMVEKPAPDAQVRLKEGFRLARDAEAAIQEELKAASEPSTELALREALVACRMALGHIAVRILPEYRDEAMLAFASGFDEMARLPFVRAEVKQLGSPMIAALASRGGGDSRLAIEERQQRQAMTRLVEAALALHFDSPKAAADQMASAVEVAETAAPGAGSGVMPNAATLLGNADGFEAKVAIHDSMHAFRSLANCADQRPLDAVQDCLAALVPESTSKDPNASALDDEMLSTAITRIQSPMIGFALAKALDAACDVTSVIDPGQRQMLVRHARTAQERTASLFTSIPLKTRYPHIVVMNQDLGTRLNAPETFLKMAKELQNQGRLAEAIERLEQGVKRHAAAKPLWESLLDLSIVGVQRSKGTAKDYQSVLDRISQAEKQQFLPQYLVHYYRGVVLEAMGNSADALRAFDSAKALASDDPNLRVRAQAKAAGLRARQVSKSA